jgi:hypothetical protein
MRNEIQQNEIMQKVSMFLDNALNQTESQAFLEQVSHDVHYQQALDSERRFRNLIKNKISTRTVSPDLIQNIKDKIRVKPI